ncbi:MAG: hypothetical protein ACO1N6_06445 [Microcella sp.]
MPTVRAVVHIGPMKTGTTAFAAAASEAQRAQTLPAGMVYPMGTLWFGDDRSVVKHHQLNAGAHGRPAARRARERQQAGLDELERALATAVDAARSRAAATGAAEGAIVLVAEGLSHQKNPRRLTALLRRHVDRVDYVLVARAQPRAIGSILAHGVKDVGAPQRYRLDVSDHLARSARARRYDYAQIVERWRHDGAALHVLPFPEGAPGTTLLTDAVLDAVDLPRLPVAESLAAKRTHPSFSQEGLRELARIKRQWRRLAWLPGAEERYQRRFAEAWERHHRAARRGEVAPWRLPPRDVRLVIAAYAESNQRFRDLLAAEADTPAWRDWFALALGDEPTTPTPAPTPEESV